MNQKHVVIAMSGGIDSSVSAYLLLKKGYKVTGMYMKNWEDDEYCTGQQDYEDALLVADKLGIALHTVNFSKEYKENVFKHFLEGYKNGVTPNPDILCNKEIKFKLLLEKALQIGADYLATGHYADITIENDTYFLTNAVDTNKDQTYFLYTLNQSQLSKSIFPLGKLKKSEIRTIANEIGLHNANKKDSTGICFVGKRDFREFISKYITNSPGKIVTDEGKVIGKHNGLHQFTIGQRKGINVGGEGDAWFVCDKHIKNNQLIVVQGKDHPRLLRDTLKATNEHWISNKPNFMDRPFSCYAKIRYRQEIVPCQILTMSNEQIIDVKFDTPQRAITPSQSIVFYKNNRCLGGAIIT
ncbi:tRNA 2-thiouridine(34) synthase MnmA [Chlamydiia bacterium]|nr:tRNA 2-thiouridine(34) synthase MnmA [Chlamydiia bacterium]